MKRVFIIHGWGGSPETEWLPWTKKKLEENGFEVIIPAMPNTDEPKIEEWVPFLEKLVGEVDEETYFIGHSVGCQAIVRYLERVSKGKAGGAVLVAPWFNLTEEVTKNDEDMEIAGPWLTTPINFEKVQKNCNSFTAIFSDTDPYVPLTDVDLFKERLDVKVVILNGMGHIDVDAGVTELPVVVEEILKLSE